ncbi:MAG: M23 family metallopeptidase [Cyclobacteriaceae bacterium]
MARIKYYYDTETCKYERVKVSTWDVTLNFLGFLSVALILAVAILSVYSSYFDSPKEALLKKENEELKFHYDLLESEVENANQMLSALQGRDDNIYRVIFEADPIPQSIRNAGVGGSDRYKDITESNLENEGLILETYQQIDQLKKKMYIQTKSYDEIMEMANNKVRMLAAIPAIQPVSNEELNRLSSGFGIRMDPIYKVRKMHPGIDFSAPNGTPIYATGDGTVKLVKTSLGGYGRQVEIDHGFGYTTKYAHMSKYIVRRGQKVKRGEIIGYVGNTGKSTAPHLHYEVHKDNKKVNPVHYFFQDLSAEEYEKVLMLASIENQSLG